MLSLDLETALAPKPRVRSRQIHEAVARILGRRSDDVDRRGLHELSAELKSNFGIGHATVQAETETEAELCRLRPDHVI